MIVAIVILCAAVAIIASGLALALLARHEAGDALEQKRGWPGDGS